MILKGIKIYFDLAKNLDTQNFNFVVFGDQLFFELKRWIKNMRTPPSENHHCVTRLLDDRFFLIF